VIRFAASFRSRLSHHIGNSLLAAALIVLGARMGVAQDPDPLLKLDPNSRFAIELMLDSAKAEGIPTRPLLSRALEGINRKADNKKIVDAVRKQLGLLRTTRSALGGVAEDELIAAAAVLEAGAKPGQLAVFRVRHQDRNDLAAF
jgi:hypothetical protein